MVSVVSSEVLHHQERHDAASEDPVVGVLHSVQHSHCLLQAAEQLDSVVHAAVRCCHDETQYKML